MDRSFLEPVRGKRFGDRVRCLCSAAAISVIGLIPAGAPSTANAQADFFAEFGPICMETRGDIRLARLAAARRGWTLTEREGQASLEGYTDYYRQGREPYEVGIGPWINGASLQEGCSLALGDSYEGVRRAVTRRLGFEPTLSTRGSGLGTWLFQLDGDRLRPRTDIRQVSDLAWLQAPTSELHTISIEDASEPGMISGRNIYYARYRGIEVAEFDDGPSDIFKRVCFSTGGEPARVREALAAAGLTRLPGASETYGGPDFFTSVEVRSFSRYGAVNQSCSIEISAGAAVVALAVRKWLGVKEVSTQNVGEAAWIFTSSPASPTPLTNLAQRISERSLITTVIDHRLFYLVTLTPERVTMTRITRTDN